MVDIWNKDSESLMSQKKVYLKIKLYASYLSRTVKTKSKTNKKKGCHFC